jgi:hypothetical protein
VEKVPESGVVSVHINTGGVTPTARRWMVVGPYVPETDVTPALLDFRFEQSKNTSLPVVEVVGGIDQQQETVVVVVPKDTSPASLVPTIKTNLGNTYEPMTQTDFIAPVQYHVESAAKDAQKDYTVMVYSQTDTSARIYYFAFGSDHNPLLADSVVGTINEAAQPKTITLTVPYGTNPAGLIPQVIHSGKSIAPESLAAQNFASPVEYTVTALNGTTVKYTVTVKVAASPGSDPDPSGITYTALANGAPSTTTSTNIDLTFNAAVTGLTAGEITILNGNGTAAKGALTGGGTAWVLALTSVTTQGNVSLSIAKSGIESGGKTVAVYKAGDLSNPSGTAISLNLTSLLLRASETRTLVATVTPAAAAAQGVDWSTSDASVVTVTADGLVMRVGTGRATITATCNADTSVSARCVISYGTVGGS